jgi:small conductance mechanosensitive channel
MQRLAQEWVFRIFSPEIRESLFYAIVHSVLCVAAGYLFLRLIDLILRRVTSIVPHDRFNAERVKRRTETLRHIVGSVGRAVIAFLVLAIWVVDFDGSLSGFFTGAGVVGLAIGFGAQSLIKDVIAGFFIILEDQYGVGDAIRIGSQDGVVEEMTLRVTVLRNFEGQVHVVPNGNIQTVTVLTKDWSRAIIDLTVAHDEDLTRVFNILTQLNEQLARDLPTRVLEQPQILGIERFSEEGTTLRLAVKTPPAKQGDVLHEWRRRIRDTFQKEGIEMPRRSVVVLSPPAGQKD